MTQYSYPGGKANGLPLVAGVETLRRSNPALTSFPLPQVGIPEGELPSALPFSYTFARGFDWSIQVPEGPLPSHENKWWDVTGTTTGSVTQALGAPASDAVWQTRDSMNANWFVHRPAGSPVGRYFQYSRANKNTPHPDSNKWDLSLVGAKHRMATTESFVSETRFPGRVVQHVAPVVYVDPLTSSVTVERYHSVSSYSWLTGAVTRKNRVCQATVKVSAGAILIGTYYISEAVNPAKTLPGEFGLLGDGGDAPQPVIGWILRPSSPPEPYIGTLRTPLAMPKLVSTSVGNGWNTYVWAPADFVPTNRGFDPNGAADSATYPTVSAVRQSGTPSFPDISTTVLVDFSRNDVFQVNDVVSLESAPQPVPSRTYRIASIVPDSPVVGQMRVGLRLLTGATGAASGFTMWRISPNTEWVEGGLYCNPVSVYVPTFSTARFLAAGGWIPSGLPWLISYQPGNSFPAVASLYQYVTGFDNWGWSYATNSGNGKLVRAVSFIPANDYLATGETFANATVDLFGINLQGQLQRSVVSGSEVIKVRLTVSMKTNTGANTDTFSTGYDYEYGQLLRVSVIVDPVTREYWYYCNGALLTSGVSTASGVTWTGGIMWVSSLISTPISPTASSSVIIRQALAVQGPDVDLAYAIGLTQRDFTVPTDLGGTLPP